MSLPAIYCRCVEVRFLAEAAEIDSKRVDEITKDDARELQPEVEFLMASAHVIDTDEVARLML